MSVQDKIYTLSAHLRARDICLSYHDVNVLRRAQMTLRAWAEAECGTGNAHCSWSIERDEETDVPYLLTIPHTGAYTPRRARIADREKGAPKRVAAVCAANGLYYYHQTDPRGCALFVIKEPLTDSAYSSNGVACSV